MTLFKNFLLALAITAVSVHGDPSDDDYPAEDDDALIDAFLEDETNAEKPLKVTPLNKGHKFDAEKVDAKYGITLWKDRDGYKFKPDPKNTLKFVFETEPGTVSYYRGWLSSALSCPKEGGGKFKFNKKTRVYLGCANHCGKVNKPVPVKGQKYKWAAFGGGPNNDGKYAIAGHKGTPLTLYHTDVPAGTYKFCCSSCWATGVFTRDYNALKVTPLNKGHKFAVKKVQAKYGITLWKDRDGYKFKPDPKNTLKFVFQQMPGTVWYYRGWLSSALSCPKEGGGKFKFSASARVYLGCANHCGKVNKPVPVKGQKYKWAAFGGGPNNDGKYAIAGHKGTPLTLYHTTVPAGTYKFCCSSCWATGIFVRTDYAEEE